MSLFPKLDHRPLDELMRWFLDCDRENRILDGEGELWLAELAALIAGAGAKGIDFLLSILPEADDVRQRAILTALSLTKKKLSARKKVVVCETARTLLNSPNPSVVVEAVDTLGELDCRESCDDVFRLLNHPSPFVVGSVLRFLARHEPGTAVPLLEKALDSCEPVVRQNAIDELDDLEYLPALPKIRRLLKDPDEDVRQAAHTALANLEEAEREQSERAKDPHDRKREESFG